MIILVYAGGAAAGGAGRGVGRGHAGCAAPRHSSSVARGPQRARGTPHLAKP